MTPARAFDGERLVVNDGLVLAVRSYGPRDGTPVLVLHGFPEMGTTWAPLAQRLEGVRIVAPDLRGHGFSDAPRRVSAYRLDRLLGDVVALVDLVGGPLHVVGHDWGGALSWLLVERHPERVRTATILSAPHPLVLRSALLGDPEQRRRGAYVLKAQLPVLPERYLARDDSALLAGLFSETHDDDEIETYRVAWSRPGVVRGMLNWYRAVMRHPGPDPVVAAADRRVHLITGADDPLFGPVVLAASVDRVPGTEHTVLDGVGHSPHREAIDTTAALISARWEHAGTLVNARDGAPTSTPRHAR